MRRILLFTLSLSFSLPALAIYKCDAGGKVVYSDAPCPGATAVDLPIKENGGTPAADAATAAQRAANEKKELTQLEKARHRREAMEEREQRAAAKSAAAKKKKCEGLALREKWSEEDAAAAGGKSAEKAKRKARRMSEKYEAECKSV